MTNYHKEIILADKKIFLREPKIEDAKEFVSYIDDLIQEDTYISSKPQTEEDEKGYIVSMIKQINKNKEIHLVAFCKDKKVGAVDVFNLGVRKEHVGELQIHLQKNYRGIGLGKSLLTEALQLTKEKLGLKLITLSVFEGNGKAISLYEKFGFVKYGELPKVILYKENYINEILMYKNIE